MLHIIFGTVVPLEKKQNRCQDNASSQRQNSENDDGFDAYKEEHIRLGALKDASEDIWEDRTYQMSAGGLSLTFAVFSYLMGQENGVAFSWPMAAIWAGFVICLVVNYLSQRLSRHCFMKLQDALREDRENGLQYDEQRLIKRNKKYDRWTNILNIVTEVLLVTDIVATIVYTAILFWK